MSEPISAAAGHLRKHSSHGFRLVISKITRSCRCTSLSVENEAVTVDSELISVESEAVTVASEGGFEDRRRNSNYGSAFA